MREFAKKARLLILENAGRILRTAIFASVLTAAVMSLYVFVNVVKISDGEEKFVLITAVSDRDSLLDMAGVSAGREDSVLCTSYDGNYSDVTVRRSFEVPVTADGTTVNASLCRGTVKDCLSSLEIELDENDYTVPGPDAPLKKGDSVRVYRVEYRDNQYEEAVPRSTDYRYSSLLYKKTGRQYVLSEGKDGKNLVTYRERYVDGELELALVSKVEVLEKPVDKVVLAYQRGRPVSPLSAPAGVTVTDGVPSGYSRVIPNVRATGYYSARGRGASGLGLYYGSVAVNPNVIPYGTKMYIASPDGRFVYGWAVATDTGTALMEGTIGVDLFYETYLESTLNGVNIVNIYVY